MSNNFNHSAQLYEQAALVQKKCANQLVRLIVKNYPNFMPVKILDVGTGTGYVVERLLKYYPDSKYRLNDLSSAMLDVARRKFRNYNNIDYNESNMEAGNFGHHNLIISNFALQWCSDLNKIIQFLLQDADILAFSTLLDGTFQEWDDYYKQLDLPVPTLRYPTEASLKNYCLSLKSRECFFIVKDFPLTFSSPLSFAQYLKTLGANSNLSVEKKYHLRSIIRNYNHPITTKYKVIFVIMSS